MASHRDATTAGRTPADRAPADDPAVAAAPPPRRRWRALTLVELLVVVLVVAVLAAVAVPLAGVLVDRSHDRVAEVELVGLHRQAAAQAALEQRDLARDDLRYAVEQDADAAAAGASALLADGGGGDRFAPGQPEGAPLRLLAEAGDESEARGEVSGAVADEVGLDGESYGTVDGELVAGLAQRSASGNCAFAAGTASRLLASWVAADDDLGDGGCAATAAIQGWPEQPGTPDPEDGGDGDSSVGPQLSASLDCAMGSCQAAFAGGGAAGDGAEVAWTLHHGDSDDAPEAASGTAVLGESADDPDAAPVAATERVDANPVGADNYVVGEVVVAEGSATASAHATTADHLVHAGGEPELQVRNDGAVIDLDAGTVGADMAYQSAAAVAMVHLDDGGGVDASVERTVAVYAEHDADHAADGGAPPTPSTSSAPVAETTVVPADDGWAVQITLDGAPDHGFFASLVAEVAADGATPAQSNVATTYSAAFPWVTGDGTTVTADNVDALVAAGEIVPGDRHTIIDDPTGRPALHGAGSEPAGSSDDPYTPGGCATGRVEHQMPNSRVVCSVPDNHFYGQVEPELDHDSPHTAHASTGLYRFPSDRSQRWPRPHGAVVAAGGPARTADPDTGDTATWPTSVSGARAVATAPSGVRFVAGDDDGDEVLVAVDDDGVEQWRTDLTAEASAGIVQAVATDGAAVWVGYRDTMRYRNGRLAQVDAATGTVDWHVEVDGSRYGHAYDVAAAGDGRVWVGTSRNEVRRHGPDGAFEVAIDTTGSPHGVAVAADGDVLVATGDGQAHRYSPAGAHRWTRDLDDATNARTVAVDSADRVAVGDNDGTVTVLTGDGGELWANTSVAGARNVNQVAFDADGEVYLAADEGNTAARLDRDTGDLVWRTSFDSNVADIDLAPGADHTSGAAP